MSVETTYSKIRKRDHGNDLSGNDLNWGVMPWQASIVSIVEGEFNGLQAPNALYNDINNGEAVQIGIFNRARDISGFQLGLVNWAENMRGIQIGLINIISGKESLQFLPIVNWSF